ncbi:MAG: hypothetical protein LBQ33_01785 [Oscillospiraceae bacterium]|jgi:hypothetical protein|nr:hypothetical protein [Oscillospiraceae bacterium]
MNHPIPLRRHLNRFSEFFPRNAPQIPKELQPCATDAPPELSGITLPLPSRRRDYRCCAKGRDGALWLGASTGLTRYDPNAPRKEDRVQFFSALRDLPDNEVEALLMTEPANEAEYESLWVLTKTGAAHITLRWLDAQEKAELLLAESLAVVDRRGMVSQRGLSVAHRPETKLPYNECDNDGCFGCGFTIGEILHYATLRRELGRDHPETKRVRAIATRGAEAMLLLMYMPGRGNGFVARTYLAPTEPVPDDGIFFRKLGDGTAQCVTTRTSVREGKAGLVIDACAPVPKRLAKLYEDEGYTDTGLVYKADTSSDETTLHFAHLYYLHTILGEDDPELDELAKTAAKNLMGHIIDHGFEMHDAFGAPTTWAKWSKAYFNTDFGWCDGCLNAAEVLMYLRVTMAITGEAGRWQEAHDRLIAEGYDDLTQYHADRLRQITCHAGLDEPEEIMYGDHMLATAAFWLLIMLEPDETRKAKYRRGFAAWRGSIGREFNPGYDLPFHLACPEEPIDWLRLEHWFYRNPASRLAAPVSLSARRDVPVRVRFGKGEETGWLLPPDERAITKFDRNPNYFTDDAESGAKKMESCYVYTFSYWIGRYYGFFS